MLLPSGEDAVKRLYFCCFKIARPSDADHLKVRHIPFLEVVATIFRLP
jgi:hypothetical protein